ncbi:Leucyl/phenylalanyl-tRNA--protein transferase [hydrothermal vent metagenome]|uniref:Leucyl/phenylalanyl-tRNA--protein transferase n=1 Tax=hydrothermal vent metagenome TaxID=652676 RepID=A0A1W1CM99_9ZZZZ
MENVQLGIYNLSYDDVNSFAYLQEHIYPNMYKNYYWSNEFCAYYYIAQAKAGFIAVTDTYEGEEFLLPEIQFRYALLDFKDLHISKKVSKRIQKDQLHIVIDNNIEEIAQQINASYKNSWLSEKYCQMLRATEGIDRNFKVITVYIEVQGDIVAGEIGYIIGKSYTSLSGFSSKLKVHRNCGTAQLVLLAQYLQEQGFAFWNLGQPYMDYKLALGAKVYDRKVFLQRWFGAIEEVL